jgi:hypothetical protein
VAHADYGSARKCCGVDRGEPRQRRGGFNRHARNCLRIVTQRSRRPFGNERKYFGVLYNNDEPDYRRSGGRGVSESERS